jgi:hypothetical protein
MTRIIAVTRLRLPIESRDLTESAEAAIAADIYRGRVKSIVVEPESLLVLDGARRVRVARKLGIEYLPYSFGRLRPDPGWGHRIDRIAARGQHPAGSASFPRLPDGTNPN